MSRRSNKNPATPETIDPDKLLVFTGQEHDLFRALVGVQSKSHETTLMRRFIKDRARQYGAQVWSIDGNIYAIKGQADLYPCIACHTDTVHPLVDPAHFKIARSNDLHEWWAYDDRPTWNAKSGKNDWKPYGIGGDDKVGIFIALNALRESDVMKAAFFRDEEIGCVGARAADMSFFDDVCFVLEADRRGMGDFVDHIGGTQLQSDDFKKAVEPSMKDFGYKFSWGAGTDVGALKGKGLGVCCANMSCGYYEPHGPSEYIVEHDVVQTWLFVTDVVQKLGDRAWPHKNEPRQYTYTQPQIPATYVGGRVLHKGVYVNRDDALRDEGYLKHPQGYWYKPPEGWLEARAAEATARSASGEPGPEPDEGSDAPAIALPPTTVVTPAPIVDTHGNPLRVVPRRGTDEFDEDVFTCATLYADIYPDLLFREIIGVIKNWIMNDCRGEIRDIFDLTIRAKKKQGIPRPSRKPDTCQWCNGEGADLLEWDAYDGCWMCVGCNRGTPPVAARLPRVVVVSGNMETEALAQIV